MKREWKVILSVVFILLSIIVISAVLAYLKDNHITDGIFDVSIVIMTVSSIVFSICFLYLIFSKLGTFQIMGQKAVIYFLFVMGLSLFFSLVFFFLGHSFL